MSDVTAGSRGLAVIDMRSMERRKTRAIVIATAVSRMMLPVATMAVTSRQVNGPTIWTCALSSVLIGVAVLVFLRVSDSQYTRVPLADEGDDDGFWQSVTSKRRRLSSVLSTGLTSEVRASALAMFLACLVTPTYPVFALAVESVMGGVGQDLFESVAFVAWNAGCLVGIVACGWPQYRVHSPVGVVIYASLRFLFVPALCLVNVFGRGVVKIDFLYWLLLLLFGFSDGHVVFSSLVMALSGSPASRMSADDIVSLAMSAGLCLGALFSLFSAWLLYRVW